MVDCCLDEMVTTNAFLVPRVNVELSKNPSISHISTVTRRNDELKASVLTFKSHLVHGWNFHWHENSSHCHKTKVSGCSRQGSRVFIEGALYSSYLRERMTHTGYQSIRAYLQPIFGKNMIIVLRLKCTAVKKNCKHHASRQLVGHRRIGTSRRFPHFTTRSSPRISSPVPLVSNDKCVGEDRKQVE